MYGKRISYGKLGVMKVLSNFGFLKGLLQIPDILLEVL